MRMLLQWGRQMSDWAQRMTEKMAVAYFEEKIGEKRFKVCQVPTHYGTLLGLSCTESF